MKKISVLIFLCLLVINVNKLKAQSIPHFGIRLGYNTETFSPSSYTRTSGLMIGVYKNFRLSGSHFSLQPELLYNQKGAERDTYIYDHYKRIPLHIKVRLHYIEIPVLAKFNFNPDGLINPILYVGPYMGIKVASKVSVPVEGVTLTKKGTRDIKRTDFGISIGGMIQFYRFNVGFRYELGEKIIKGGEFRNDVFSIIAGINL
jgi:hypothetical protein